MTDRAALSDLRVLDLTDLKGALCAKLMGDMGADVIKIEPPGGDAMRTIGPFLDDKPHRDRSLLFWFYNTSKRGVTLDLYKPEGQDIVKKLVEAADVIVESFAPGALERLGLGYDTLKQLNPRLVLTSITPFGQTGPYRDYQSSDTIAEALGGMLYVNGAPTESPLRGFGLQAYHSAAFFATIGTMSALWTRDAIDEGQWVDVSIQEATAACVEHVAPFYHQGLGVETRRGSLHWSRYFRVARCKDGYIMHCSLGDWTSLVEWVKADDKAQDLSEPQWEDIQYRKANAEHLFDVLDDWAKDYTTAELMEGAQLRRIPYAMVRPPEALVNDPQLNDRGFFPAVEHPELGKTFRYPGGPFFFTKTPWRISRRPPLLGEHNREIYSGELGLSEHQVQTLVRERVI
jgi:crotonobetainyl-CoA:carnitine CoA-transferase CaiB-like acyl-CoA transferase